MMLMPAQEVFNLLRNRATSANSYLLPPTEGLTAGATAAGPTGAAAAGGAATPSPSTPATTTTAAISGVNP